MTNRYQLAKLAAYASNTTMAAVGNLSPLLFLVFRELYGISFSLLGTLVLINFGTQLFIDLLFSFFSHRFNIPLSLKCMAGLGILGFVLFGLSPFLFPNNVYLGLVIGTIIFSMSSGFAEVLVSPVIDAIPSDDPEAEMSKLHAVYAFGVVGVVLVVTIFFAFFENTAWPWLAMIFTLPPLLALVLYFVAELPPIQAPEKLSVTVSFFKNPWLYLCVVGIFLGGAAELIMAQWCSAYLETALNIDKSLGDILGVAFFALMLGIGRYAYSKWGKNIEKTLLIGASGAALCYLVAVFSPWPILGLAGAAMTGLCVSMLWPGSLLIASERFRDSGVFIFALMAAGGDLGAALGPQAVGWITDFTAHSTALLSLAERVSLTADALGMKLGLLLGALISIGTAIVMLAFYRKKKRTPPLQSP